MFGQLCDLVGDDDAASTSIDLDVAVAELVETIPEVPEVLHVAALVRRQGNRMGVFLDDRLHDVRHGAVVTEMDDLGPLALQDPPHDVDGGVVTVEEARCGHDAHGAARDVELTHEYEDIR